jgi:hypothetical protein
MIKVADIYVSEDGCGPYNISVCGGADASYFKIIGKSLYFDESQFITTTTSTPSTPLSSPRNVTAQPLWNATFGSYALVSWTAPLSNGGSPITDYLIQYNRNNTGWFNANDGISSQTFGTVRNLVIGSTYIFRVLAYNGSTAGVYNPTKYSAPSPASNAIVAIGNSTSSTTTASPTTTAQPIYSNNGTTFTGMGSASSPFYLVVDLGQTRTFNMARYYQMFSDGKATHAALDISSNNQLNTRLSTSWTEAHGYVLLDNLYTSDGVSATFSPITARYLRLRLYNDGRYGNTSYTELYNFKLFSSDLNINFASTENGATVGTGASVTNDNYAGPNLWAGRYNLDCNSSYTWGVLQALCTNGSNTNSIQRSIK